MVVTDVGLLGLSLRVLRGDGGGGGCSIKQGKQAVQTGSGAPPTVICTASSPSPASLASMVNSTGREAGTPVVFRPGPLARTLLASWVGSTFTL